MKLSLPLTGLLCAGMLLTSAASAAVAELARRIAADHFGDGKQQ